MFNLRVFLLSLILLFSFNSNAETLDLTADPVTPSLKTKYSIKINFGGYILKSFNTSEEYSYDCDDLYSPKFSSTSVLTSDYFNAFKKCISQYFASVSSSNMIYTTSSSRLYYNFINVDSFLDNMTVISNNYGSNATGLTYTSPYYFSIDSYTNSSLESTYSENKTGFIVYTTSVGQFNVCPSDYSMHSDNFCYPILTTDYESTTGDSAEFCQSFGSFNVLVEGIFENKLQSEMLINDYENNVKCLMTATYKNSDVSEGYDYISYDNRQLSYDYLNNPVQCVDQNFSIQLQYVTHENWLKNPSFYPVVFGSNSSIFCSIYTTCSESDENCTVDNYLDNPLNQKCVDDFDCDGLKNDVDPDIDNDGILNDEDDDDDNDGLWDWDDLNPHDDDADDDGFKDGDSRDSDGGTGTNNDSNDGYEDVEDCDADVDESCLLEKPDGTKLCGFDDVDTDNDGYCGQEDFDDNNPSCWVDADSDGFCNDVDFDDNNNLCWIDKDKDGYCNNIDVDDDDPSLWFDLDEYSQEYCEAEQADEYDHISFESCVFFQKLKLEIEGMLSEQKQSPLFSSLFNLDSASSHGLSSGSSFEYDNISISESRTNASCPSFTFPSLDLGDYSISVEKEINFCDESFDLVFKFFYFSFVFSTLLYCAINFFNLGGK